ncbi:hypothetical protein IQ252_24315 [Tychonema sp. LEGE 07203]|nr:hypothetical protein [Tychonema sp. LEGE 07203]
MPDALCPMPDAQSPMPGLAYAQSPTAPHLSEKGYICVVWRSISANFPLSPPKYKDLQRFLPLWVSLPTTYVENAF